MRTRRSPRNQEILWRALFAPPPKPAPVVERRDCFSCRHYPKGGRSSGRCALLDKVVSGLGERECFVPRPRTR